MNRRSLFWAMVVAPVLAVLPKPKLRCLDGAHVFPYSLENYGSIDRSPIGDAQWEDYKRDRLAAAEHVAARGGLKRGVHG